MVGTDRRGLIMSGGDEGASGQMVGFTEQTAGPLVNGGNGCFVKEGALYAGYG